MSLILTTRRVVYYHMDVRHPGVALPLLCIRNEVTYTHHQNDTCVTLFTGTPVTLLLFTQCLVLFMPVCGRVPHFTSRLLLFIRCRTLPYVLTLGSCHLLQYSLRFGYIPCHCIWFAIIVFYRSETYCQIFALSCIMTSVSSTMPSVLQILR